jgi:hypothetical protein
MKNLNALGSSLYVGLRVAKSFTISKIKCYGGSLAACRFDSKLFADEEKTRTNWR